MSKPILITAPVGNNPARCRMLIYHKGLEETIDMKSPADYGGLASPEYRKLNPQGKMPALILPSGETLYEAKVVLQYLNDKYGAVGPPIGADTPEARARAALITQVHDLYIASPNSSDPKVTANQGAMYKPVEVIDAQSRSSKLAELNKQLDVLEGLIVGPFAAGEALTEADFTLWPTLGVFFPVMLPLVFGWKDPMDDALRPKVRPCALPTAPSVCPSQLRWARIADRTATDRSLSDRTQLRAWYQAMKALPAAERVRAEVAEALDGWEKSGRFVPIIEQMKANPELQWVYGPAPAQ